MPARTPATVVLRVLLVVMLAAGILASSGGSAEAARDRAAETEFVDRLNAERTLRGLAPLRVSADLTNVAYAHSTVMASEQRLHHNPNLRTDVRNWSRIAENVGVGPSVSSLHTALMNSPGHRANILHTGLTEVGVGVELRHGRVWVTQVFRNATGVTPPPVGKPATRFDDVPADHPHYGAIEKLAEAGITSGCRAGSYCPTQPVTRAQMATFLTRALDLPSGPVAFSDVPARHPHAANIGALVRAEITTGCTSTEFCPASTVTRGQMASFLARALGLPPAQASVFADVPSGHVHGGNIGALVEAGITTGCRSGSYCPAQPVTRGQMATFLVRALDL